MNREPLVKELLKSPHWADGVGAALVAAVLAARAEDLDPRADRTGLRRGPVVEVHEPSTCARTGIDSSTSAGSCYILCNSSIPLA